MLKDHIIYCPYAYEKGKKSGENITNKLEDNINIYLKNASVALISAKHYNPDCTVALVTNLYDSEIPSEFKRLFKKFKIEIIYVPYDYFLFEKGYLWSLAFYKLCALKHIVEMEYSYISYMDTDVYVQMNEEVIWKECSQNIMLYDINHGLAVEDYKILCAELENYYNRENYITHYGGEFFAATKEDTIKFIKELEEIYEKMKKLKIFTSKGDEFLISICANSMKNKIKNASPYIYRFWTESEFRLISTVYKFNKINILHVPAEKNKGMIKLYDKYISKGKIPKEEIVWKTLHLIRPSFISLIKMYVKKLLFFRKS